MYVAAPQETNDSSVLKCAFKICATFFNLSALNSLLCPTIASGQSMFSNNEISSSFKEKGSECTLGITAAFKHSENQLVLSIIASKNISAS